MTLSVKSPLDHPDMIYRRLGNSGLFVSAISLGGWVTLGGSVDDEGTVSCIKQAWDCGINFFDTAEVYGAGESEKAIGHAIKKLDLKRSDLVISTKLICGNGLLKSRITNTGLSRKHVIEGTKASLKRLDLEYVDIIFAHRPDPWTPMEEIVRGFNFVINQGWAFYWGTSMWAADEIAEACCVAAKLGLVAPVAEQPVYNMLERKIVEGDYFSIIDRFGLGTTIWSPLKQGILTGKYNDYPNEPPAGSRLDRPTELITSKQREGYGNEEWQATIASVRNIEKIAGRLGVKLTHLALAWCLKNENVTTIITGASRPQQIVENVEALKVMDALTPAVMEEIDGVLNNKPKVGKGRIGIVVA